MAKKRSGTRREKRDERKREREAAERAAAEASTRRKWLLIGIGVATLGGGVTMHQLGAPSSLLGMLLLVGTGLWLAVALGGLGGSVKSRDTKSSGNIDFGK